MLRILRAFVWMRWRIFVNSLERTSARDSVERVSLLLDQIAPMLLIAAMIPASIALAALGWFAGWQIAANNTQAILPLVVRYLLLAGLVSTVLGPVMMPVADRTNPVRFLLLPIPASTLYVAQTTGALSDPWILLLIPLVMTLPVGLFAAGATTAALIALVAGVLFILILVGSSALTNTVMHLLLRDRRRGELVALLLILLLPIALFLPAMAGSERRERRRVRIPATTQQERRLPSQPRVPEWLASGARSSFALAPSELYMSSVTTATNNSGRAASGWTLGLASFVVGLHGLGLVLFRRVLAGSGTRGRKRVGPTRAMWGKLPGLSPRSSAVALALIRLVIRTPRGRAALLAPLIVLVFFGMLVVRSQSYDVGPFRTGSSIGLALFSSLIALVSSIAILMNQFAVDRAGLTLTLLSPLSTRQILLGKAIGGAVLTMGSALLCIAVTLVVFPGGHPALWLSLILSIFAIYVVTAPAAAIFSALFPRVVDMSSIGRKSNAHGLAVLLGMLTFFVASAPCGAIVLLATRLVGQPWLAPVLLLIWCGVVAAIARLLFIPAERIFERRRENLAMLL